MFCVLRAVHQLPNKIVIQFREVAPEIIASAKGLILSNTLLCCAKVGNNEHEFVSLLPNFSNAVYC